MELLTKFKNRIMVICCMSNSRNSLVDIEKAATIAVYCDKEEEGGDGDGDDDNNLNEADKAVASFSATCVSLLFGGPASVLFVFNPETHGHQRDEDSHLMQLLHDASLAANFLAMSFACVLLYFTLAYPAPSRWATRIKKIIAHISLFWFVLGVFSRIYLALPSTYRNPVMMLTGMGLLISTIVLLGSVLLLSWSTRNRKRKKPKSSQVSPVVDNDKIANYVLVAKENPPELHGGKRTTEDLKTTENGMVPVKGGGGLSSPFEYTGYPSALSNQGINQPSSRKGKQTINLDNTIKSYEKGVKHKPNQFAKAIKLLDEVPGIKKYSHQWLLAVLLLQDFTTQKFFIGTRNPSARASWIQWNYYNHIKRHLKEVTPSNEEVIEKFSSMMQESLELHPYENLPPLEE